MIISKLERARDTSPEMEARYRAMLMARSGEERLKMGDSMYATARALVVASILERDPSASPAALRQALFLRFYGHEFDAATRGRILARLGDPQMVAEDTPAGAPNMYRPLDIVSGNEPAQGSRVRGRSRNYR